MVRVGYGILGQVLIESIRHPYKNGSPFFLEA
jgi:hypothetical protein